MFTNDMGNEDDAGPSCSKLTMSLVIIQTLIIKYGINANIFIPRHTIVAGYYGFTLDLCVSVRPSVSRTYLSETCPYFCFQTIT